MKRKRCLVICDRLQLAYNIWQPGIHETIGKWYFKRTNYVIVWKLPDYVKRICNIRKHIMICISR